MLSLPTKAPICDLYRAALKFIWHRYYTWVDEAGGDSEGQIHPGVDEYDKVWLSFKQEQLDGATDDLELLSLNIQSAAKLACLNLATRNGGNLEILSPSGATPRCPVMVFGRPATVKGMPILDQNILPNAFLGSRWPKLFSTQTVFETIFTRGILNWSLGIMDVDVLEAEKDSSETKQAKDAPEVVNQLGRKGLLPMLRPYHGCPVLVPEEWLLNFTDEGASKTRNLDRSAAVLPYNVNELSPSKAIISFAGMNPTATKRQVKAALYPQISERQFKYYFALAAEEKPELKLPGRKPRSRG
ncbi:MAG: hypothetical protein O9289_07275 [Rhodobacteraceae bacterium]|jgi:hypothetical protein|nr:hypothetical protein [Paracoccaceae bacterium]MCZ8082992.1 hypothetical protein [Paracoccaceae bacterium]